MDAHKGGGSAKYEFAEPPVCPRVTLQGDPVSALVTPASVTRRSEMVTQFKAAEPKFRGPDQRF